MKPAPGTLAIAVSRSQNAKIGECATTYAAQTSCPRDCVFFAGGGCYAEEGPIGKFITQPLNRAAKAVPHDELDVAMAEAAQIDALEIVPGRPLRLHTVGDCSSDETAGILAGAAFRYLRDGGGPVFTYTHAWREVERASWGDVSVLASCETPIDAALARARGYATALTVEEFPSRRLYEIAEGAGPETNGRETGDGASNSAPVPALRVLPCPAQTTEGVSCSSCRLCFDDEALRGRGYSIGFALHGNPTAMRFARRALRTPDDPDRRLTSRELIPRLLAAEPDLSGAEIARRLDMNASSVYDMLRSLEAAA